MKAHESFRLSVVCCVAILAGCASPPGQPHKDAEVPVPTAVADFDRLYAENCAGCHGPEGRGGAAIALANPVYQRIVDDATIRSVIANGVRNTAMPAFAQHAGGMLTDAQIDVIAREIRSRWGASDRTAGMSTPSYTAQSACNARDGEAAYQLHCSACHGASGQGTEKASSITNDAFLALVSDQGLRTMIIA